jgi:hypothetical protein
MGSTVRGSNSGRDKGRFPSAEHPHPAQYSMGTGVFHGVAMTGAWSIRLLPWLRMGGILPPLPVYAFVAPTVETLHFYNCSTFSASVFLIFCVLFRSQMYSAWYQAKCHIPWKHIGVCPSESCTCLSGDPGACSKDRCKTERFFKTTTSTRESAYSILCLAG